MIFWIGCLAAGGSGVGFCADATWRWECPELGAAAESVTVEPVKFGKSWAYALEFDDGGVFAQTIAAPMLEKLSFTDAPPGVSGGRKISFVASMALYPFVLDGDNGTLLTWEQIRGLRDKGWGVSNHSYWHTGNHWEPKEFLDEAQMRRELFWSQAVLSHFLAGGKEIIRRFVYPSGDFHYGPFLAEYGLNTTPVAVKNRNSLSDPPAPFDAATKFRLTDRNNMDAGAWDKRGGDDMESFPQPRPAPGELVLDFTHGMGKEGESNVLRWERRLGKIASDFGAGGDDSVWCGATGEIIAYHATAIKARAGSDKGGVFVEVPPGSFKTPLTLRIKLSRPLEKLPAAPPGALLYRQGDQLWLTTPPVGDDLTPGFLRAKPAHTGPFQQKITFAQPVRLAAVRILQKGDPGAGFVPEIAWLAKDGSTGKVPVENALRWVPTKSRWGNWLLFPVVPDQPAPEVVELNFNPSPCFKQVEVWTIEQ
ncbi:MAG: hypothetical protein WCS65_04645 [Verrucomicrobiae bacterium]